MPLVGLICPDGQRIETAKCFRKCRFRERCAALPTLRKITEQREWTGVPSTTQLLNGTMLEFLKLTQDYYIYPESRAFAVLGTMSHAGLENYVADNEVGEQRIIAQLFGGTSGKSDYLDPKSKTLYDYKTWGSYRVARFLGMSAELAEDPTGQCYQRATTIMGHHYAKGHPKMVKLWTPNPLLADTKEIELQMNNYRMLAQAAGYKVTKLRVQITVRDGDTVSARSRGIDWRMRVFPVDIIPNDVVQEYFTAKREQLLQALEAGRCEEPCTPEESWDSRRCSLKYCDVADKCPQGIAVAAERANSEDERMDDARDS